MPGLHNVSNALAAICVGLELGIPFEKIERALGLFSGINRRLEVKGEARGVTVIDDYGHHPAEVQATLDALRQGWPGRIVVIFQPHRYTRTRDLFERFGESFGNADLVFLMEIYAAGEQPIPGVDASLVARAVTEKRGGAVQLLLDKERAVESVIPHLREGDVVLTLGAGDVWKTGEGILEALAHGATPGGSRDSKG